MFISWLFDFFAFVFSPFLLLLPVLRSYINFCIVCTFLIFNRLEFNDFRQTTSLYGFICITYYKSNFMIYFFNHKIEHVSSHRQFDFILFSYHFFQKKKDEESIHFRIFNFNVQFTHIRLLFLLSQVELWTFVVDDFLINSLYSFRIWYISPWHGKNHVQYNIFMWMLLIYLLI